MNDEESPMSDTMPDCVSRSEIEEWKQLQQLGEATARHEISDAVRDLIAAVDYRDKVLGDSSFASLLAVLAEVTRDFIVKNLDTVECIKSGLKEGWQKYFDKKAYEIAVFEELKDKIESIFDEQIASMLKSRKLVNMLQKHGQHVENADALEDGIRDLRRFREKMLKGWPSRKPPSPIDGDAIAKAREAIARGEKGLSKDELVWGNKRSERVAGE
jgi:hypothetical protein